MENTMTVAQPINGSVNGSVNGTLNDAICGGA